MTPTGPLQWAAESAGWLAPLLVGAGVLLLVSPLQRLRASGWTAVALLLGAGVCTLLARFTVSPQEAFRLTARTCAILSLLSTVAHVCHAARKPALSAAPQAVSQRIRNAALILGSIAFAVLLVILVIRTIYAVSDLANVLPVRSARAYGFAAGGLFDIACLIAACATALATTRVTQLGTSLFLLGVMFCTWASLLAPVFRIAAEGGMRMAGATSALAGSLSVLLVASMAAHRLGRGRAGAPVDARDFAARRGRHGISAGFRISFGAAALVVMLLVCYHLAVPVDLGEAGFRPVALASAASAALASLACFCFVAREWGVALADAAVGLMSLAICCLAVSAVPDYPQSITERYPVVFNAMIVGLALATALCTKLVTEWRGQSPDDGVGAFKVALVPHAKRGAFINAVFAVSLGGLMALWPQLPAIAVPDDSIGRVTAGFGANLLLLLVVLWSARRLRRMTFHILSLFALGSTAGFMFIRMLPYALSFR